MEIDLTDGQLEPVLFDFSAKYRSTILVVALGMRCCQAHLVASALIK